MDIMDIEVGRIENNECGNVYTPLRSQFTYSAYPAYDKTPTSFIGQILRQIFPTRRQKEKISVNLNELFFVVTAERASNPKFFGLSSCRFFTTEVWLTHFQVLLYCTIDLFFNFSYILCIIGGNKV
jgi:hypothetical protein